MINRCLSWIDEAATEFWVFHLLPKAAVMQMWVLEKHLRGSHRPPGEAPLLGSVVDLLCRPAGYKFGDEIIDYMRCIRRDDRLVLVFGVHQITGHAVAVQQLCQVFDEFRVQPTAHKRTDVPTVLGTELGTGCGTGSVMATCLSSQHLAAI